MSVVSEKTIRKIIAKKVKRRRNLKEVGFKNFVRDRGEESFIGCDLSFLKNNRRFHAWFAKNFLYNPQIKFDEYGKIKTITKRNFGILSYNLSRKEEEQYQQAVDTVLQDNPRLIDTWISALEAAATVILGPYASVWCKTISLLFSGSSSDTSFSPMSSENAIQIFVEKVREAGDKFKIQFDITEPGLLEPFTIFFPKTSILLSKGDLEKAKEQKRKENERVTRIVSEKNVTPETIYERIFSLHQGQRRKRITLGPLEKFLSKSEIKNDQELADKIRSYIDDVRVDALYFFESKF